MMAVMHLVFKFNKPMFIQGVIGLKNLFDAKIVAIHLFGKPASGNLRRPFLPISYISDTLLGRTLLHFLLIFADPYCSYLVIPGLTSNTAGSQKED